MIEDFFHLPPVSTTPVVHLELWISQRVFRKNLKRPQWYTLGLGGNWFMKKTRSRKSRDTVPLNEGHVICWWWCGWGWDWSTLTGGSRETSENKWSLRSSHFLERHISFLSEYVQVHCTVLRRPRNNSEKAIIVYGPRECDYLNNSALSTLKDTFTQGSLQRLFREGYYFSEIPCCEIRL